MQQFILNIFNEVLSMIGTHGIFAVMGSIFITRSIRQLFYFEEAISWIIGICISMIVGAASVYWYAESNNLKDILGGVFMTPVAVIITYETIKWCLGILYEKTKWDIFIVLFFCLSPKPVKIEENGEKIKVSPHSGLTEFFERARLDKMKNK